jgi:mono/diheme cytochrome c family protein
MRQRRNRSMSRSECMVCHSRAANFVLGLNVLQMNRRHDYGTTTDNQLKLLQQLSVFTDDTLPGNPQDHSRLVDPYDARADLTARARSYLHANCSQCHVVAGGGNSQINLDFASTLAGTKLIDTLPQHRNFGTLGNPLVNPGDSKKSILYERVTRRGQGQMPPLATSLVDHRGAKLLSDWINSLPVRLDAP